MRNYLYLMRAYQWIKNLFIFAPAFFAFQILNPDIFFSLCGVFLGFSLVCSSIYVVNDIFDRERDRLHHTKASRPLASGAISPQAAAYFAALLLLLGLFMICSIVLYGGGGATPFLTNTNRSFDSSFLSFYWLQSFISSNFILPNAIFIFLPICVYVFLNIAYTLKLKHIAIVDICVIATGFVLRLFIGSFAAQVALSHWIIVITFCLSLFLALAKRRGEWQVSHTMRPCLQDYNLPFFDCALGVLAAIILIAYILYSIDSSVTIRMQTSSLYLTSIFVLLGILRYLQLTFVMNKTEDPSKVVLKDRFLQIVISLWIISFFVLLYL